MAKPSLCPAVDHQFEAWLRDMIIPFVSTRVYSTFPVIWKSYEKYCEAIGALPLMTKNALSYRLSQHITKRRSHGTTIWQCKISTTTLVESPE